MNNEEYEKRKQEILKPIFITREEALEIKEKELADREKRCKDIEIISKQLMETTENADVIIGKLFREFECNNPCSEETTNYLTKLWVFISERCLKEFGSDYKRYRESEKEKVKRIEKHKILIRKHNMKIKELETTVNEKERGEGK